MKFKLKISGTIEQASVVYRCVLLFFIFATCSQASIPNFTQADFAYSGDHRVEVYTHGPDLSGTLGGAGGIGGILADFWPQTSDLRFFHADAMGNVVLTTDSSGDITSTHRYTPFGRPIAATGSYQPRFGFSSKEYDQETGLNYYGYRYLAVNQGRWINRDPIGEIGGLNLYGFLSNNAVNGVDVLGLAKAQTLKNTVFWLAKRIPGRVEPVRLRRLYTRSEIYRSVAKREGYDVVAEGMSRSQAKTLGRKFIQNRNLLSKGYHAVGHIVRGTGRRGLPHIQDSTVKNSHLFYRSIGAMLATGAASEAATACTVDLEVVELISEGYEGPSGFNALTFTHWVGGESRWRHLDWVNPLELIAIAGDAGRAIDRRLSRETVGYIVTIFDGSDVLWTLHFDSLTILKNVSSGDGHELHIDDVLIGAVLDRIK